MSAIVIFFCHQLLFKTRAKYALVCMHFKGTMLKGTFIDDDLPSPLKIWQNSNKGRQGCSGVSAQWGVCQVGLGHCWAASPLSLSIWKAKAPNPRKLFYLFCLSDALSFTTDGKAAVCPDSKGLLLPDFLCATSTSSKRKFCFNTKMLLFAVFK